MKMKPVTTPNRQRLLERLKQMRDEGPDPYYSICNQMPNGQYQRLCNSLLQLWPDRFKSQWKRSDHVVGDASEYRRECIAGTFWKNPRRHAALHWLINHLDQELNVG